MLFDTVSFLTVWNPFVRIEDAIGTPNANKKIPSLDQESVGFNRDGI